MSSEWSSEICLAEAVANSVHINSLVLVNGIQLSQLMVACLHGNIDYVEALLEVPGVKVDLQNDEGFHALQCACLQGHTEIAQLILNTQQCQDLVNLPNKWGNTCLTYASRNGHTETIFLLLQNSAHINMQNNEGSSSLIVASLNGHTETVLLLLQNCALVNIHNNEGWTPLMAASQIGHTETVLLLLQNGAHVNMQNNAGSSSLMAASQNGHTETVSLLLQNGAHVNMKYNKGWTSLMLASENGHTETVSLLLQNGAPVDIQNNAGSSSLMAASQNGHTETVLLLLQNGAHINMQNNEESSSLMIACHNGHTKTVSLLLQNGAHINMQSNGGSSSLMAASRNGHTETVSLLLQNGAHVNMQNNDGRSSLMFTNSLTCSQLLIAYGGDMNLLSTTTRLTALAMAIIKGNTDIALHLIDCGADMSIGGSSALFYASLHNQISVIKRILDKESILNITNSLVDDLIDGYTPLMVASSCGHVEIVQLLLEAGVRVNFNNFSDYQSLHLPLQQQMQIPEKDDQLSTVRGSALDMAVIRGRAEVVSLLLQYGAKVHNIYYLLRSITLKQAQANAKSGNSDESHWEKYSIILQILFSNDSDLIGRVQCTNPSTLYMACAFGAEEMVSLLIELGADVSDLYRTDVSGLSYWCSFVTIISSGSFLSATASNKTSSDVDLLHKVNWDKYSRLISILTENGLDVNHKDSSGSLALNIACREGHADLVGFLLKCRAYVNLQDGEGLSSLMEAVSCGHLEICLLLFRYRAKVNLQDSKGWSALMLAVTAGHIDFVLLLLERRAEINLQDASGTSPLMLSCFAGDTHVTKVLLGHGADANLQNEDGITALMMSSYNGHTEIVELLLEYGADLCVMTCIGMTALRVSTDNGHKEVTKLLIEHGANRRVTSSLPIRRKRSSSARDSTLVSTRVVTQDSDTSRLESKLDRMEQILQSLLQNQSQNTPTTTQSTQSKKPIKLNEVPKLSDAFMVLHPLAYNWQNIGVLLNLENNSLKAIHRGCNGIPEDCLREMLDLWLMNAVIPPTWEELAEAVEPTDQTIARKIRRTS